MARRAEPRPECASRGRVRWQPKPAMERSPFFEHRLHLLDDSR
jgi:hypothetical protein